MSRALLVLDTDFQRRRAAEWCMALKDGTRVEFKGPKRSLPQNDLMWALLTEIATQLKWHGQKLTPDDWKLQFLDALRRAKKEELHLVPNLDNSGFVNLSVSSSDLSRDEMSELIELILAFGANHGVVFKTHPPAADNDAGPAASVQSSPSDAATSLSPDLAPPPTESGETPTGSSPADIAPPPAAGGSELPETATSRVDDLGSVQDALKMSTDGQPNAGLSTACVERQTEAGVTSPGGENPAPSEAAGAGIADPESSPAADEVAMVNSAGSAVELIKAEMIRKALQAANDRTVSPEGRLKILAMAKEDWSRELPRDPALVERVFGVAAQVARGEMPMLTARRILGDA